ncbi:hypothetical protein [Nesterenkonia sp. NBAIMH1]|nr:hypothetical protein [Nesterenkonia sp. NBAIMH1]
MLDDDCCLHPASVQFAPQDRPHATQRPLTVEAAGELWEPFAPGD